MATGRDANRRRLEQSCPLPGEDQSPAAAAAWLRDLQGAQPLPGLGDEAYLQDRNVYVRISNLLIVVFVYPNPTSDRDHVTAFVTALVHDLADG